MMEHAETTAGESGESQERPARGNLRFLAGALVAVGAVVWLTFTSFESQTYYYTVDQALARAEELGRTEFQLKGQVVPQSHMVRTGTLDEHRFLLNWGGRTVEVTYRGALPDTFRDEAEVVALGELTAGGGFVAQEVVARCPSRYEARPPTAAGGS